MTILIQTQFQFPPIFISTGTVMFDDQSELIKQRVNLLDFCTISSQQAHYLRRHIKILLKADMNGNKAELK